MKNPCKMCIVNSCCTNICKDKYKYTDSIIKNLSKFSNQHIYSKSGNIKKHIPKNIKVMYNHLVKTCQKNKEETNLIFKRI